MRPKYSARGRNIALIAVIVIAVIRIGEIDIFAPIPVGAATTSIVQSTVNLSICGGPPYVIEDGEDCELDGNLNGRSCLSLGFSGGVLGCDLSCSYELSSCIVPVIDPLHVDVPEVPKLAAAGYLDPVAPLSSITSTNTMKSTTTLILYIPMNGGSTTLIVPDQTTFTAPANTKFDATTFYDAVVEPGPVPPIISTGITLGTFFLGPTGAPLNTNSPITVSMFVGNFYNGSVLEILRSVDSSNWLTIGINPTACTVTLGQCVFQTTATGYFTVKLLPASITPSATALPTPLPTAPTGIDFYSPISFPPILRASLPQKLQLYDFNNDGIVSAEELEEAVRLWVASNNDYLATANNNLSPNNVQFHCDINTDKICNLIDFSILMYHIDR